MQRIRDNALKLIFGFIAFMVLTVFTIIVTTKDRKINTAAILEDISAHCKYLYPQNQQLATECETRQIIKLIGEQEDKMRAQEAGWR